MRLTVTALAALAALPLGGCCSMARFFCGPDRTTWVSERFDAPERTVATLLEALRRDDPEVVYLCLADTYRQQLGLDGQTVKLAWERVRDAAPGLFLAGYAEIPEPTRRDEDRATFHLLVEGHALVLELVCEPFWEVRYRRPDGSLGEAGAAVPKFGDYAASRSLDDPDRDLSELTLAPLRFEHEGVDEVPPSAIEHAALSRRWRVAAIEQRRPE